MSDLVVKTCYTCNDDTQEEKSVRLRGVNREAIENKATMRCEEEGDSERNKGFFR